MKRPYPLRQGAFRLKTGFCLKSGIIFLFFFCCACAQKPLEKKNTLIVHTQSASSLKSPTQRSTPIGSFFEVRGKASLSDAKGHTHFSLRWKQVGEHYDIRLYGPLGHGAVRLSHEGHQIHYQDMKGEVRSYGSAEALLEKECGWTLPISGLSWWLRGLPRPAKAALVLPDHTGLTTQIEQEGWIIEYLAYQTLKGKKYPHKLRLRRDKLILKLVLHNWHIDTKPPA